MPELPEVETIRRGLERLLVGHRISGVEVRSRKILAEGEQKVLGTVVKRIRRFAKVLVIDLSNGFSLIIHIKLTGQLVYRGPNLKKQPALSSKVTGLPGKHTHVIFHLDKHGVLFYNDLRKFGWMKVAQSSKLKAQNEFLAKLGPEPLKDLTLRKFRSIVSGTKAPIKVLLMDQEKIAGVGNIYANDALWLTRIHPKHRASSLSTPQQRVLYDAVLEVLRTGLEYGGASELSYVTPTGEEGKYQEHFLVYGRQGQLCSRCRNTKIVKTRLAGRGTYWCPACQHLTT